MKLRKGRARYKIPAHSQVFGAVIASKKWHFKAPQLQLRCVSRDEMARLTVFLGVPQYFCVDHERIEFFPSPDRSYTVKVRYAPPVAEF